MLTSFNGLRLCQQPTFLFQRMHGDQPATSFRRSVTSTVRSFASGESGDVFESRIEESTGSGQKRVVIERGMGSKAMKLTQISDGCGGVTEERVFTNVSKEEESMFHDSNWHQATAKLKLPAISDGTGEVDTVTPSKALCSSPAAHTPTINSSGTLKAASDAAAADAAAPARAEQEVDEHGVPITGSFEATDDGRFHETDSASNSSAAADAAVNKQQQETPRQQEKHQKKQQQQQQQDKHQRRHSRSYRSDGNAFDADLLSRQLLNLQHLSRALDPFDAWSTFEPPRLHHLCAFAPRRDAFPAVMFRRPLIDVWG